MSCHPHAKNTLIALKRNLRIIQFVCLTCFGQTNVCIVTNVFLFTVYYQVKSFIEDLIQINSSSLPVPRDTYTSSIRTLFKTKFHLRQT